MFSKWPTCVHFCNKINNFESIHQVPRHWQKYCQNYHCRSGMEGWINTFCPMFEVQYVLSTSIIVLSEYWTLRNKWKNWQNLKFLSPTILTKILFYCFSSPWPVLSVHVTQFYCSEISECSSITSAGQGGGTAHFLDGTDVREGTSYIAGPLGEEEKGKIWHLLLLNNSVPVQLLHHP